MSENPIKKAYSELILAVESLGIPEKIVIDEPLKKYTTWRVGGPADLFIEVKSVNSLISLIRAIKQFDVPYFLLGGGSNILVGDKGFRGLVIRVAISEYELISGEKELELQNNWSDHVTGEHRHTAVHFHYYTDSSDPSFGAEQVFLRVSSGYPMPTLIRELLDQGITGLEKFMRIPGTLGGWIYNNTHGHTQFIGDFVYEVRSITSEGEVIVRSWNELGFGYDQSIFHTNREVILDAVIRLFRGDVEKARVISAEIMKNKLQRQPSNSGGCVFHNITPEDKERNQFESNAVGYIVDKKLGWLGSHKVGGAWISNKHGNFIETDGTATAQDILAVMDVVRFECKTRFNIDLREEIFRIGEF